MTSLESDQPGAQPVSEPFDALPSAGAQLRAAREAAQLTVDDVAHQLKLARRQVLAIENDDFDLLPGPTFVRGFIRNYARLLRIDAEPVLEAGNLIAPSTAPMQQLAPTMGELPLETGSGLAWTRWLIPSGLALVLIAGIAYYEFFGVPTSNKKPHKEMAEAVVAAPATSPEPAAQPSAEPAAQPPGAPGVQPPNIQPPNAAAVQAPSAAVIQPPGAPAIRPPNVVAAQPPSQPAANPSPQAAPGPQPTGSGQNAAATTGRIDLEFAAPSWVEVRDARGEILVSRTLSAKETLTGVLPLTLRIGNAGAVRLQFDGNPVDLAPHTRLEIARLTLPLKRP